MARKGRRFKAGDRFDPWVLNEILEEQDRWRDFKGSGFIVVNGADSTSPPQIVDYRDDGPGLIRAWLPSGIADGGTFGTPTTATDAILAVRSGNGWTTTGGNTVIVYNCYTTGVSSGKSCWVVQRNDGTYELAIADC